MLTSFWANKSELWGGADEEGETRTRKEFRTHTETSEQIQRVLVLPSRIISRLRNARPSLTRFVVKRRNGEKFGVMVSSGTVYTDSSLLS